MQSFSSPPHVKPDFRSEQGYSTEGWTVDPRGGIVDEHFIYGIGVSNLKAGDAAYCCAVKMLTKNAVKLEGDVILTYVVDELLIFRNCLSGWKPNSPGCGPRLLRQRISANRPSRNRSLSFQYSAFRIY